MSEQTTLEATAGSTITPVPVLKKRTPAESPAPDAVATSTFILAHIDRIIESDSNPRKAFDEQGMAELVESVREKSVIQPILIRPAAEGGGYKYEIVFGARRFRAAKAAGLELIPAQVRNIIDQEVLELQITENLQRRDVHPMEEANAIEQLLNYGRDLDSIAAILGQSKRYVATRLKLCDLTPEFRTHYLQGLVEHREAKLICTLTADAQADLIKDAFYPDHVNGPQFSFPHLASYCGRHQRSLVKAKFKTEDPNLVPEMGACGKCVFNSSNSLQLFVGEGESVCNKPSCYATKTNRAFLATIEELRTDPNVLFVSEWHHSDEDKANVKMVRDMGIEVLKDNDFQNIHGLSESVPDFEVWVVDYKEDLQFGEEEEYKEAEARAQWEEEKAEEAKDRAKYQKELDAGIIQRAFCVAGREAGTFIYVKPSVLTTAAKEARSANTTESDLVKQEIAGIEMRERRAVELDREKVTNQIQDFLASEEVEAKRFQVNTGGLLHSEWIGFAQFLWSSLPGASRIILGKRIGIDAADSRLHYMTRGEMPLYHALKELSMVKLDELITAMVRPIILRELPIKDGPDYEKRGEMATFRQIATDYAPAIVAEFDAEQRAKAAKRIAKVESRIEALKKKSAE